MTVAKRPNDRPWRDRKYEMRQEVREQRRREAELEAERRRLAPPPAPRRILPDLSQNPTDWWRFTGTGGPLPSLRK